MIGKLYISSLRFRFFSVIAIALFIGTISLSAVIAWNEYKTSRGRIVENGMNLALFIAKLSEEPLIARDGGALDSIVHDALNEKIAYSLIYDAEDKLMTSKYASLNDRLPLFNDVYSKLPKDTKLAEIVKILSKEHHIIETNLPILIGTKPIGRIVLGMSDHLTRSQVTKTFLFVVTVNLLVALLLCLTLIMVSRKILLDPLMALVDCNRKLAQGDLAVRLDIRAKGEMKLLVDSFNHMAASLDKNEQQLRVIFDASRAGIIIVNDKGKITLANQSMSDMFRYTNEELISRSYSKLIYQDKTETYNSKLFDLIQRNIDHYSFEKRFVRKDGGDFWGYVSARKHISPDGKLISIVCIISDITEQKLIEAERLELERKLLHSQKLESLGVLAGGIAHDFNNLLTVILGNLDLALLTIPSSSPAGSGIENAIQACKKAAALTNQMLAYSGKGVFELKQINLNQLVRENINLFSTTVPKTITFSIETTHDLPTITADPGQIQQVVMNLITNASEAIGNTPGAITLFTGIEECTAEYLAGSRLEEKPPAGHYAYIEVSDYGAGMDEETKHRVFEPFYTTKFTGRGLGMSAVLGIIKAHGGAIMLKSKLGIGTTFRVLLPISTDVAVPTESQETQAAIEPATFTGTVLIVDDEEDVRDFCKQCVSFCGFSVLTASDGVEALEVFEEHGDEIRLVILDMTMPRMDGFATFRELRRSHPGTKIIISTGHATQNIMNSFTGEKPDEFIQKPFRAHELQEKIALVI